MQTSTMFAFRQCNNNITTELACDEPVIIAQNDLQKGDYMFFLGHNFSHVYNETIKMAKEKFNDTDRLYWFQKNSGYVENVMFSFFGTENAVKQFKNTLADNHVLLRMPMGELIWGSTSTAE